MQSKKKSYPTVQFGTSLMLVVFIILTLTAFATLSLSGALRDYEYSQRAAKKAIDFYQADLLANQKLSDISNVLTQTHADSDTTYITQALSALGDMDDISVSNDEKNPWVAYEVPINERQNLTVQLALTFPVQEGQPYYRIVRWQEVPASPWTGETKLPVMGSQ